MKLFLKKRATIEIHNSNKSKKFTRGLNQFSALTPEEFQQTYLGYTYQKKVNTESVYTVEFDSKEINANIDWRNQGAVGPIKNQGKCGSCWAFSTVAGLESTSKIFHGQLQSFS
jgi:KDEL-tailed cysteine endopeptidase